MNVVGQRVHCGAGGKYYAVVNGYELCGFVTDELLLVNVDFLLDVNRAVVDVGVDENSLAMTAVELALFLHFR